MPPTLLVIGAANWDRAAFAARLGELVNHSETRSHMTTIARARSREFGVDRMIEETLAVYRNTLDAMRKPAVTPLATKKSSSQQPAPSRM